MSKFYGLYGLSGLGIYNSWTKCQESKMYAGKNSSCKKFDSYEEAVEWTLENYDDLIFEKTDWMVRLPDKLSMNFMLFTKKLKLPDEFD